MNIFGTALNFDDYVDTLWIISKSLETYKTCLESDLRYYESRSKFPDKQEHIKDNIVKVVQIMGDVDRALADASPIHYERDNDVDD